MGTALVGLLSAVIVAVISQGGQYLRERKSRREERQDTETETEILIKNAVMSMLHDRLYQACKYYISAGEIDTEGLQNIDALYTSYHALNGNGTGTRLYEAVCDLPIKE